MSDVTSILDDVQYIHGKWVITIDGVDYEEGTAAYAEKIKEKETQ